MNVVFQDLHALRFKDDGKTVEDVPSSLAAPEEARWMSMILHSQ